MDLPGILTAAGLVFALAAGYARLARLRPWLLMIASVLAVYLFQPSLRVRYGEFVLPTATLALTVLGWWLTRPPASPPAGPHAADRLAFALLVALVMGMTLPRALPQAARLALGLPRPPDPLAVAAALAGLTLLGLALGALRWRTRLPVLGGGIIALVALFVVLKTEPLAAGLSAAWRAQTGQDVALASAADVAGWLGFSYIAFRLIHLLRDRQTGKLPALSLRDTVTYVVFFPSLIAGPIDRAERFQKDLLALPALRGLDAARWVEGGGRIAAGVLKKFVLADTLAQGLALNTAFAEQVTSTPALWLLVYGYALRLFLDFSGYSDIAIGVGIVCGVRLPENFDRPYLKRDLTAFWQSWHMTLSTWARFYVFTPLTRLLLTRLPQPSPVLVVLVAHLTTMLVIGLWHGVTLNFALWGVWHGLGLFAHKQWNDRTRAWSRRVKSRPATRRAWAVFAWLVTFHYVALGWVWFALPTVDAALRVFGGLVGLRG